LNIHEKMSLRIHAEYEGISGMEQGIVPRFYLQMLDLSQFAGEEVKADEKLEDFRVSVIPELDELREIYVDLIAKIADFIEGVESGRYYTLKPSGHTNLDRRAETQVKRLTKSFFLQAKLVLENFVNCGLLDDTDFKLSTYIKANEENFKNRKKQYETSSKTIYKPLLNLIEKANSLFLMELKDVRGSYTHKSFTVDRFEVEIGGPQATAKEPDLGGAPLSAKVSFIYEGLLDFLEKMMAYYLGINAEIHLKGVVALCVNDDFNYAEQRYKYTLAIGGVGTSFTSRLCQFD
jgi:hypothetical protein